MVLADFHDKLPDVLVCQQEPSVLLEQPDKLFCCHCGKDGMVLVRLATQSQLEDWLAMLHSNLSCMQPEGL